MKKLTSIAFLSLFSLSSLVHAKGCEGVSVKVSYGGYSSTPMTYVIHLSEGSFHPQARHNLRKGVVSAFESITYPLYQADKNITGTIVITPQETPNVNFNIPFHFEEHHKNCEVITNSGTTEKGAYQTIVSHTGSYVAVSTGLRPK